MRDELVAIDLETTGLDPTKDDVIEIGAVRIRDGIVVDEFSTLVDPDRPIPTLTTFLTGIDQEAVHNAPRIHDVLSKISAFTGDSPVITHNDFLDMGILQGRYNILSANKSIDTYDLASVLLPRAARYSLNSLTQEMGIVLENAHRALDDARATALLYWELWKKAHSLPIEILAEISRASQKLNWDTGSVFTEVLQEMGYKAEDISMKGLSFSSMSQVQDSLPPRPARQRLDLNQVTEYLKQDGHLAKHIPNFQQRSQQIEMATGIAEAFNSGDHLIVEAGTGIGKSLAYLLPAALWATQNNERVIISTNTINLQDQIINNDIPLLEQSLEVDFKTSVMKGRSNYLCPRRLEAVRRRGPTSIDELRTLAKIIVWLQESNSGDRSEISLRGPVEYSVWQRLSAQDEDCSLLQCEGAMAGECPFFKARKAAEAAHLLIVNHALLISDANSENHVLPEYHFAIIDEAHQLEDAVTSGLSVHLDKTLLTRRIADLGGLGSGLLGDILSKIRGTASEKDVLKLETFVKGISEATSMMEVHIRNLFAAAQRFITESSSGSSGDFMGSLRIDRTLRSKGAFAELYAAWKNLDDFFEVISEALRRLTKALVRIDESNISGLSNLISGSETAARYLLEMREYLHGFIVKPDDNVIYWISLSQGTDNPVLHTAPLHIGPMMEKYLWHEKESIILTSATLRTHDSFDYIRDRLYADGIQTIEVGSPFNYEDAALVYIPDDISDPTDKQGYQKHVEQSIIDLAIALDGRVMVLFTSYSQLRQTSQAVTPRLALHNITVYDQSDGSSRQTLLDGFKSSEKAVMLGTKSFWEGIDIPGEALSALVITRLPFAVPTDPIFATRSDTYGSSFSQYALPDAILRFRQGFGRLIRSQTDRGIVVILDIRVLRKGYGANFLDALPNCKVRTGPLNELGVTAKNWLQNNK